MSFSCSVVNTSYSPFFYFGFLIKHFLNYTFSEISI
ncbi:hypothetical protein CLOLEP_00829 [[Clostridium] leptum DSM 753]|uniref:Uncharacterized protein n=1 Tax=[Clostridium] leptum DSM 753 TaxID=428125 RepID=A7VQJ8_9FIRM|nr:hypothetical protein CLOLEP_00829 [[Clostridium] leptum DSM 753]